LALVPADVRAAGKTELTVDERLAVQQRVDWLSPLAEEALKAYLADARADRVAVAKLNDAWTIRERLRASNDEQNKLVTEQGELEKASRETRLSLEAIEKNNQAADLRAKLTKRLGELQTRLDQITKRMVEVRLSVQEQQVRFRDAIREIKVLAPLPPR
jgi:chromosome segregation ATPase